MHALPGQCRPMINNASILLSILATGYVVFRAIQLDKLMPWFGRRSPPAAQPKR